MGGLVPYEGSSGGYVLGCSAQHIARTSDSARRSSSVTSGK